MTNADWHIELKQIKLDNLHIDPAHRQRIIVAQPYYELVSDERPPFRISDAYRETQKQLIQEAFRIRSAESSMTNPIPIRFILFPEYSIPAQEPDGLGIVQDLMNSLQEDIVFIGGIEGVSHDGLQSLCTRYPPASSDAEPKYQTSGDFVNVCVIAVKSANAAVEWYYQAKLRPSQWERDKSMANGLHLLHLRSSKGLAFICQTCFDHIAQQAGHDLNDYICQCLIGSDESEVTALNFVFVPQFNESPIAPVFREHSNDS